MTSNTVADCQPAWSPDGRSIAFLRELPRGRAALLLIPALGGPERKLTETSDSFSAPAWSPDGKWLVIVDNIKSATESRGLLALSMETGEKRRLTTPPSGSDSNPVFSPDGRALGFVRSQSRDTSATGLLADVFVLELAKDVRAKAEPRRITFDTRYTYGLAWTDDGRELLFSSGPLQSSNLRRVAADGSGTPQRLTSLGSGVSYPAIARQGRHLAYMRSSYDSNIWRVEVPDVHGGPRAPAPRAAPFLTSTRAEFQPEFSPDGKRIAFASGRSSREGKSEIWVSDSDGSSPVQLTSLDAFSGTPRWSPDGERIAFDSDAGGKWAVFVVSGNGGKPKRMTSVAANDDAPNWSRDGKSIYFVSDRNGVDQVWKMPAEGGESVQITKKGGAEAAESFDGKTLYYAKGRYYTSLWKVPVGGGEETQVLESLVYDGNFAVVDSGIYFSPTLHSIEFFSFATRKISSVATSDKRMAYGLTISPDRRWILYAQIDQSATELMLVENFR